MCGSSPGVCGFDFDGFTDLIWHNSERGEIAAWFMDQTQLTTSALLTNDLPAGWRVIAAADFNRDGYSDLFCRSQRTGDNEIWLMNEIQRIGRYPVTNGSPEFNMAGTGDFNGDGWVDLFWRDPARNITAVWFMEGVTFTGNVELLNAPIPFTWSLAGTGDFNNDGNPDLIWRDRYTGGNTIWLMNGLDRLRSVELRPEPDLKFELVGTGAFNLLGNTDLVWRHSDGRNLVWLMQGTDYVRTEVLTSVPSPDWRIAGTGGYTNEMLFSAESNDQFTELNLRWKFGPSGNTRIERRAFGAAQWDLIATNYVPSQLTDASITFGERYEYRVGESYLLTGIAANGVEERGRIVVVVDESIAPEIETELELLKTDLIGDGWSVIRTNVPRHDDVNWSRNIAAIASIKSFITNVYYQDPRFTKAVYLIGHVPIPYSGFGNPDGHGSRALPADVYYGDVDGIYTDEIVHSFSRLEGPRFTRHDNFIGDGKFDQSKIPPNQHGVAELELAVGRADFANLSSFFPKTDIDLTRQYIQKTHRYRHGQFTLPQRVSVDTFFSFGPNRDAHGQALRMSSRLFGSDPKFVFKGDPLDPINAATWGIIAGYGLPFGIAYGPFRYHQSINFSQTDREPRLAFANFFGSFFVDHQYPDNFMRAFLATPTYGLAATWFKPVSVDRIALGFEPVGYGETMGTGFVRTINQSQPGTTQNTFLALLGDPTLRLQIQPPPEGPPQFSASGITIEWPPSADTNSLYVVYQSRNGLDGPWVRVTPRPILQTQFTDVSALIRPVAYQVRAVGLSTTGSGSFINLSQGLFVEGN